MSMIFLVHDNFTKENIMPNGFNMSAQEQEAHRFSLETDFHLYFMQPQLINIDYEKVIPISLWSYKANPEFFQKNGKIYYIICLNGNLMKYHQLYMTGSDNWLEYLNTDIFDLVNDGKITLVLQILIEPISLTQYIHLFHGIQNKLKTFQNFEIWTTSKIPDFDESYNNEHLELGWYYADIIKKHLSKEQIDSTKDFPYFELETKRIHKLTDTKYKKEKQYTCFSRRYTRERLIIHSYLLANNLIDLGYNSMPPFDVFNPSSSLIDSLTKLKLDEPEFAEILNYAINYHKGNDKAFILDQMPVSASDETMYKEKCYGYPNSPDLEQYCRGSYLNLVLEGEIQREYHYFTEKTYRAMYYKQLFLLISPLNSINTLKMQGYKTFDRYWDESYDLIDDVDKRMKRVLEIFTDLVVNKKLRKIYKDAEDILEHNFKNFLRRTQIRWPND